MADVNVQKALEDRILLDIEKTGFPLELRVLKRFIEAGCHVQNSVFYVDRDEGKGREISRGGATASRAADAAVRR